jgi:predicted regulator of Ras-like GTPase activity (Roadblock/LC7/MglB family)
MVSEPPRSAPERLVETSADVRSAVLIDAAGGLLASSDPDRDRSRSLAELAHGLVEAADAAATEPTEQLEVQVVDGIVFVMRDSRMALACVAGRLALPALVLYDLSETLRAERAEGAAA